MLNEQAIFDAARRAAAAATHPASVMLFGSYARGEADDQSDLDLLIIEDEVADKAGSICVFIAPSDRLGVGVDVLVFSRRDFERRSLVPGSLPHRVRQEGRLLYDPAS
jgi:uncharacterized protein